MSAIRNMARAPACLLAGHQLCATGTTGRMLSEELGLPVTRFHSGPFGGDQQAGPASRTADRRAGALLGPDGAHPHDHDVKALPRVAVPWNIPVACNRASADFLTSFR
jgi:methylglyoxal synthase